MTDGYFLCDLSKADESSSELVLVLFAWCSLKSKPRHEQCGTTFTAYVLLMLVLFTPRNVLFFFKTKSIEDGNILWSNTFFLVPLPFHELLLPVSPLPPSNRMEPYFPFEVHHEMPPCCCHPNCFCLSVMFLCLASAWWNLWIQA